MTGTIGGPEAKISLRMWSDSRSFYDVAKHIDLKPAIVLEIGQTPVPQK